MKYKTLLFTKKVKYFETTSLHWNTHIIKNKFCQNPFSSPNIITLNILWQIKRRNNKHRKIFIHAGEIFISGVVWNLAWLKFLFLYIYIYNSWMFTCIFNAAYIYFSLTFVTYYTTLQVATHNVRQGTIEKKAICHSMC